MVSYQTYYQDCYCNGNFNGQHTVTAALDPYGRWYTHQIEHGYIPPIHQLAMDSFRQSYPFEGQPHHYQQITQDNTFTLQAEGAAFQPTLLQRDQAYPDFQNAMQLCKSLNRLISFGNNPDALEFVMKYEEFEDNYNLTSVLNYYSEKFKSQKIKDFIREIYNKVLMIYSKLIYANPNNDDAKEKFKNTFEFIHTLVRANTKNFNVCLNLHASLGDLDSMKEFYGRLKQEIEPDIVTFNTLYKGCVKAIQKGADPKIVAPLFKQFESELESKKHLTPSKFTIGAYLNFYRHIEDYETFFSKFYYYLEQQESLMSPALIFEVFSAYYAKNDLESALEFFYSNWDFFKRLQPDHNCFDYLLRLLIQKKRYVTYKKVIHEIDVIVRN